MKKLPLLCLFTAIILFVFSFSACGQKNATNSSDQNSANKTSSAALKLTDVLNDKAEFLTEDGKAVLLKDYRIKDLPDIQLTPQKYAMVDFDGDGTDELVMHTASGGGYYLVFRQYDGKIYVFPFGERAMINLKTDGSFIESSSATINAYCTLAFEGTDCKVTEKAYADDAANTYRLDGKKSTKSAVDDFINSFNKKTDVTWTDIRSENSDKSAESYSYNISAALAKYEVKVTLGAADKKTPVSFSLLNSDGKEIQHFDLKDYQPISEKPVYFADVTFDGNCDVLIPYSRTAAAQHFSAFVWDADAGRLKEAKNFETLSNPAPDGENKTILSSSSSDKTTAYAISKFEPAQNEFVVQKTLSYSPSSDGNSIVYKEEALKDGKLQTVNEFTVKNSGDDSYKMDPKVSEYYKDNTTWSLNSDKWQKYINQ